MNCTRCKVKRLTQRELLDAAFAAQRQHSQPNNSSDLTDRRTDGKFQHRIVNQQWRMWRNIVPVKAFLPLLTTDFRPLKDFCKRVYLL
jgi:hypothetical protein